jgi:parallel beta-helix repeat protein
VLFFFIQKTVSIDICPLAEFFFFFLVIGISLDRSDNNNINSNEAVYNGLIGIEITDSFQNKLYGNNLSLNGKFSAYDRGKNYWSDEIYNVEYFIFEREYGREKQRRTAVIQLF